MKRNLLTIVVLIFSLAIQAQKTAPQLEVEEDYYLNFWKQNLDSLTLITNLPFEFQITIPQQIVPAYSNDNFRDIVGQLETDILLHYDSRVEEILTLYIQNGEKTAFALAYSKHLESQFQEQLIKAKLPTTLKYLPLALTAMNPKAKGKTGASGLWQLMYSTARNEGLNIDSYVDERREIRQATHAAINELSQLFRLYQNWELALGAYACGPSNVNKTIRRMNNQMDYYVLYPKLPEFGRDIVPALTAAAILSQFYAEFDLSLPDINFDIPMDTVEVSQPIHFVQLGEVLNVSLGLLRFINPQYKHDIVPAFKDVYNILLPKGYSTKFNILEDSIYHHQDSVLLELKRLMILPPPSKTRHYAKYEPQKVPDGSELLYYHIKSGDNLGFLASWYDVKVSQIEDWNNIYDPRRIQIGKELKIYVPKDKVTYYRKVDELNFDTKQRRLGKEAQTSRSTKQAVKKRNEPLGKDWFYHTVKSGESPYSIAKKYTGVSFQDIVHWNNIDNPRNIKVGQKLKIKKQ